ncbi:hypothetical protein [Rathayibacter sp. VKM Ac-2760]|uniref:hypothetical protein n=1 Tax=Rathayibacter sp. VKM Ac-2760 TaxID=2609253 RepID=UPI001315D784|nr:hypothetical protein [Rathayibacter sp. VKM Ac-2760]QHC57536.1 hypothetical protein GSU72_02255 [Rathayibacter sp. VKM Ac-2760]
MPALAVLAPVTLAAVVVFRVDDLPRSLLTVAAATGFHLVVLRLVRDRGNQVQARLWERWGGQPTAARLRWRSTQDHSAHGELHRRIQRVTGVQLPTASAEHADPGRADAAYERAVAQLRELTRDHARHHRVFTELLEYSAARNLLGVKPLGLVVAVVVAVLSGAAAALTAAGAMGWSWPPIVLSGGGAVLAAVVWLVVVTPAYVESSAARYADALLGAVLEPGRSRS